MAELGSTKIYGDLIITGSIFVNGERKDDKWDAAYTHSQSSHAYLPLTGGTMTGILYPQSNTSYTTAQARRITLSTANPSGGVNGQVWIKYV